jgi:hypothetical protein
VGAMAAVLTAAAVVLAAVAEDQCHPLVELGRDGGPL